MYKKLKIYIPDNRDPEVQKKELIEYFQQEYFDGNTVFSISKALQDKQVTAEQYAIYRQCASLNTADIQKTLANKAGTFRNDYSRMTYILAILKNHIDGKIRPVEPEAEPQPKATVDKLRADDLISAGADDIHKAWLKLSESERQENWEKAIAEHRPQREAKVYEPYELF